MQPFLLFLFFLFVFVFFLKKAFATFFKSNPKQKSLHTADKFLFLFPIVYIIQF